MRIIITRIDSRRSETTAARSDGVTVHVSGYPATRRLPHDLAHLAVEEALELRHGFWGCVASGALLPGIKVVSGTPAANAADRSREIVRASGQTIGEAEALVAAFGDLVDGNLDGRWPNVPHPLDTLAVRRGARPVPLTKTDVARVAAAWRALKARWDAVPVGGSLELEWHVADTSGSWPALR